MEKRRRKKPIPHNDDGEAPLSPPSPLPLIALVQLLARQAARELLEQSKE